MLSDRNIKFWVEIYFDAEDVADPSQIGFIKQGLWKIVVWELDQNNEAVIDSCDVRLHKLSLEMALIKGQEIKQEIQLNGNKCYISKRNIKCLFPMRTAEYEFIGYEFRV